MKFSLFSGKTLLLLSALLLLQACGAERDEPFDPTDPEPEQPDPVDVTLWVSGTQTRIEPDGDGKGVHVARTEEEYFRLQDIYVPDVDHRGLPQDFDENGQFVFVDSGIVDQRACVRKVRLRNNDATGEETATGVVTLILQYDNVNASGTCEGTPTENRPFAVFYVESRDLLIVREALR